MNDNELFKHTKYVKQLRSEKTGKWSFKVFIPYGKDGRTQTYTKTFAVSKYPSIREAFNAAVMDRDQFLLNMKTIGAPAKTNMSVLDTLNKSFEMSSLSAETIRKKRLTFSKWVDESLQSKKITDVIASDIQLSLANASRNEKISQGILDDLFCIWTQIFKTAMKMDVIYRNPIDKVDRLKTSKKGPERRIAETDLDTLLAVCDAIMKHTSNIKRLQYDSKLICYALKVSWFTALRPAEVLGLEYRHVDLQSKTLYVRQEVGMNENRVAIIRDTKTTKSSRNIPLTDEALQLFREIMRMQKGSKYLFADYDGNLMNSTKTADKINKVCKQENIQFNWYCLRHQYSTDMQRNNVALSIAAKGMGHENINMTYQYTRMSDKDLRIAMNNLGRTLKKSI